MAELWEDECLFTQHRNGMILAEFGALAAVCTVGLLHLGDQNADLLALLEDRLEEQVGIRGFDVTVQKKRRRV